MPSRIPLVVSLAGWVVAVAACGTPHASNSAATSSPASAPASSLARAPASSLARAPASSPAGAPSSAMTDPSTAPLSASSSVAPNLDADDELVVGHDVVAGCPSLRAVQSHLGAFDPDALWLAVIEAVGECLREGGPLAEENIGVAGDEAHRHVVREVLSARGVAPTRIVATPMSPQGVAECQGGADCSRRIEITISTP